MEVIGASKCSLACMSAGTGACACVGVGDGVGACAGACSGTGTGNVFIFIAGIVSAATRSNALDKAITHKVVDGMWAGTSRDLGSWVRHPVT